ncbi:MAG: hypothetical protein HUK26_08880, partial [Duodenibacillus sp.]|nr:hypothetical protein [Duodenibacillus sp.]
MGNKMQTDAGPMTLRDERQYSVFNDRDALAKKTLHIKKVLAHILIHLADEFRGMTL